MSHIVSRQEQGLSPRMRGNPRGVNAAIPGLGSIPAHAGEPGRWSFMCGMAGVYPRACGGTTGMEQSTSVLMGLSPRMRGNPFRSLQGEE